MYVMYPSEQTWANADRFFICIATADTERSQSIRR
jgi:hypothetical protein